MGGLKWKTGFFRTQIRQYERTSRKDRGKEVKYPSTEYNRKNLCHHEQHSYEKEVNQPNGDKGLKQRFVFKGETSDQE